MKTIAHGRPSPESALTTRTINRAASAGESPRVVATFASSLAGAAFGAHGGGVNSVTTGMLEYETTTERERR